MKLRALVAAAIAGCLAGAVPASAATFYTVFRGTLVNGADPAGAFGAPGVLSGDFHAVFKVSDEVGAEHLSGSISDTLRGGPGTCGSALGCPSPIVEASITINGKTVVFPTLQTYGTVETYNSFGIPGAGAASVTSYNQTFTPSLTASLLLVTYTLDAPVTFQPYSGVQAAYYSPLSVLHWADIVGGLEMLRFSADLKTDRVYITSDPGAVVPEPTTWSLAILGFGAIGASLRRKRAVEA